MVATNPAPSTGRVPSMVGDAGSPYLATKPWSPRASSPQPPDTNTKPPPSMGSLRSSGSTGGEKALVESVDADAACALLSTGRYGYVDVRMWEDFDGGHVAGARNVPYYLSVTPHGRPEKNGHFVDQVAALHGKEDHLIVGCRSGVRSKLAAVDLVNAGLRT